MRWAASYFSTRRLDDSLAEFELALQLNPNFSLAQGYYGLALSYCGRWQEADEAAQRAIRLSPRDPSSAIYYGIAAYAQFVGRNYQQAIALAREAIRQRGDFTGAYRVLTVAAAMTGQARSRGGCIARAAPRPAQHLSGLDRQPVAVEAGRRPRPLPGSLPPRGSGLASLLLRNHPADPEPAFR
jgi:tetratricopeptide (TPR) repeat protein